MRAARRPLRLLDLALPGQPVRDVAFSRAWLDLVAAGEAPETFRLYRPDDVVAFSALDAADPGFGAAVAAARAAGFAASLRLGGGRAAAFHRETLAFAWTVPVCDARLSIHDRFEALSGMLAAAFRRLGVDARVGEVPGEYCPGRHSVNARGLRKLAGVGQRVIRNAAHVGGVIVVARSDLVRSALQPVYEALGLPWDPETAGSLSDELGDVTREDVAAAIRTELEAHFLLETGDEDLPLGAALAEASRLASRFEPGLCASSGAVVTHGGRRGKTVAEPG